MIKKLLLLSASLAFVFSFTFAAFAGEGPATITIKGPKGKKQVEFKHHVHQSMMDCAECHHSKGADGKQKAFEKGQKIQGCATCHTLGKSSDNIHINCKGCHKEKKKEGKNAPTGCKGCHE